jgi:hypothetical protein
VSPILVRPVREQLEHDRLIRYLQQKYKRKFDVALNMGDEQAAPVKIGPQTLFPDLVLTTGRKLAGVVEVESGESVNNLEAMAQWVHFSRSRVPFHLYVPVPSYETARRLCEANHAQVTEIWTYRPAADGFDLVRVFNDTGPRAARHVVVAPAVKPARPARPTAAGSPRSRAASAKKGQQAPARSASKPARGKPAATSAARRPASSARAKTKSASARKR